MAEFENIYIYVSDSLRYDYIPDSIAREANVIPTLIPAGYSPISFASLASGRDSRNHDVRSFYDTLQVETAFQRFENSCFFDHPDDALVKNVFRNYDNKIELEDIETPFFYIERAMDTHSPYGVMEHGNKLTDREGRSYRKGVESTEQHFWSHVEELKERGIYEETLIIFTSDHGEFLGESYLGKEWNSHNKPLKPELCVVPTVFLNHENSWGRMRTVDIATTALSLAGKEGIGDGLDLTEREPESGYTMLQIQTRPLITTGCNWRWNGRWKRGSGGLKTDMASLLLDHLEPIRQKIRHTRIADLFGSDVSKQRNLGMEEDIVETENLDV